MIESEGNIRSLNHFHSLIKKFHLESFLGETINSLGEFEFELTDELISEVKKGENISFNVLEFFIL